MADKPLTVTTKTQSDVTITRGTDNGPGGKSAAAAKTVAEQLPWGRPDRGAGNLVAKYGDETALAKNFVTQAVFYPGNAGQGRLVTVAGPDATGARIPHNIADAIDRWVDPIAVYYDSELASIGAHQIAVRIAAALRDGIDVPAPDGPSGAIKTKLTRTEQRYLVETTVWKKNFAAEEARIELGRQLVMMACDAADDNDARSLAFAAARVTMDGDNDGAIITMIENLDEERAGKFGDLLGSSAELEFRNKDYDAEVRPVLSGLVEKLGSPKGGPAAQFLEQVKHAYPEWKVHIEPGIPLKKGIPA
jgi:hypothetical protein